MANAKSTKAATATKATKAQAPAAAPQVVALRGGLVLGTLALSGKQYRVAAPHNVAWWEITQKVISANKGAAPTHEIVKAGVPASMVGYLYRRGYLAQVVAGAQVVHAG